MKLRKWVKWVLAIIWLLLVLLVTIFIKKQHYKENYQIGGYQVSQIYNYRNDLYTIKISNKKFKYSYEVPYKKFKKNFISDIKEYVENDVTCINILSDYVSDNSICYNDKILMSPNVVSTELQNNLGYHKIKEELLTTYDKINIYNYGGYEYYLWNYHGFYHLKEDNNSKTNLFKKDTYDAFLITKLDRYLIYADYSENYYFNRLFVYDTKKDKYKEINLKQDVSFNSRFIGSFDKSVYLLDYKEEKEYEVVPHKLKYRKLNRGVAYTNNKLSNVKLNKLLTNKVQFEISSNEYYLVKDNVLYYQNKDKQLVRISNNEVNKIMYQDQDKVLYLVDDTLYLYSTDKLETKILDYSEWHFNKNILVFPY